MAHFMSLTVDSVSIADIREQVVWLQRLLGGFELCFNFEVVVKQYGDQARWATILGARVGLSRGTTGTDLGIALCVQPKFMTQTNPGQRGALELRLALSPSQLNALEEIRNGGDLDFKLTLIFEAGNRPGVQNEMNQLNELHARVSRSDWINQLNGAQAMNILLLEVPLPIQASADGQDDIGRSMRRAREHFLAVRYDDCVGECRKILEGLPNVSRKDVVELLKVNRSEMSKEERDQSILFAMRNYCNLPHHPGSFEYTRADAKLILILTASYAEHRASPTSSTSL